MGGVQMRPCGWLTVAGILCCASAHISLKFPPLSTLHDAIQASLPRTLCRPCVKYTTGLCVTAWSSLQMG